MHKTKHLEKRMSQRGLTQKMVDLVHRYGKCAGDKVILNRKDANDKLKYFRAIKMTMLKAMNNGVIPVRMEVGDSVKEFTLGRKEAKATLQYIDDVCQNLLKVIKKGGITLVEYDNAAITAYNNYK